MPSRNISKIRATLKEITIVLVLLFVMSNIISYIRQPEFA